MGTKPSLNHLGLGYKIPLILTVAGTAGIPAIFLAFTWNTSPWSAALDKNLWRIAWPFFLPILISITSLRWHTSMKLSQPERVIAYLVSTAMVCVTLSGYVMQYGLPNKFKEWIGFFFPFIILAIAFFILLRTQQNAAFKPYRAIITMQTAYLANSLLCLSAFWGAWQIGAYCSLVTTIVYLIQIAYVWRHDYSQSEAKVSDLSSA